MEPQDTNGWAEWKIHVLAELKRLNDGLDANTEETQACRVDIASLKGKAGVWGTISGFISATIVAFATAWLGK